MASSWQSVLSAYQRTVENGGMMKTIRYLIFVAEDISYALNKYVHV